MTGLLRSFRLGRVWLDYRNNRRLGMSRHWAARLAWRFTR